MYYTGKDIKPMRAKKREREKKKTNQQRKSH